MNNLSLFTGSGIGDWAAKQAGITTVAQCENDPCCLFCLGKLWPNTRKFSDVRHVSVESLRGLGPIDIISGGFPCQDLSTAGRGAGIEGGRSGLWREMFRVIRQVRPAWCVIENVPAIRLRGVDRVIAPMERIGYAVWPLVVGAEHVGAPHKRHRVWLVAYRQGIGRQGERRSGKRQKQRAGIAGEAMANAEQDGRRPWSGEPGNEGLSGLGRCEPERGGELAHAERIGREGAEPTGGQATGVRRRSSDPVRWPSRPGEPQHEWEAPRLIEFGLGDATDGLAGRLRSRANKSLLRMAGNGWVPQIPELIYRWIAEQERRLAD